MVTPKARSTSPISVGTSQITVKTAKTETVRPEPPVRKSSLTSATANSLVSSRLLQFQSHCSETEKSLKPRSVGKAVSLGTSQDVDGTCTLSVKKAPSPTHATGGGSTRNSLKRMVSDGRPPRPLSKTVNGSVCKNNESRTAKLKATSSQQTSKPSVKPKPSVSAASVTKTKSDLRTASKPNSAKSPVHSGLRQPSRPKQPKAKSPVSSVETVVTNSTDAIATATGTAVTKVIKEEEKSKRVLQDTASKMDSQFKRSSDRTITNTYTSKVGSPKIIRKQFGSAKGTPATRSAIKAPSRALSAPVPKKPKPPPILSPKPALNENTSNKAGSVFESLIPSQQPKPSCSAGEQNDTDVLSGNKTLVNNKPNQEILSSTEISIATEATLESKEKATRQDTLNNSTHLPVENNDEDIYDDVIHSPTTNNSSSSAEVLNVKNHSTGDIPDDIVVSMQSSTKHDDNNSLSSNKVVEVKENENSDDTGIKITAISSQPNEEKEQSVSETNSDSLVQQSSVLALNKQEQSVVSADDIYDDVVVHNTSTISVQENSLACVSSDDQVMIISTATTTVSMKMSNLQISMDKQSLPTESLSISHKNKAVNEIRHDQIGNEVLTSHQHKQFTENEALYDEVIHSERLLQSNHQTINKASDEDFQVAELCVSPRQSRVASFQRAGDKSFSCRDSGLGIEAYYDKVGHPDDYATGPSYYDQIGGAREQLEAISSTEDVLQSESSTENILVVKDLEPPALPPRSEDMIKEINESKSNLTVTSLEVSSKVEMTTVESGFEDHCVDGYYEEALKDRVATKVKPDPLVIPKSYDDSPPPLPPRRPHSTQLDADDMPLRSPGFLSQRESSSSPQLPLHPQRKVSAPQLLSSPKEFASSSSSLAPSHSAVSIISGRSEDRNITDGGSDVSSLVDVGGELTTTEHKKEKSKFSLGFFSRKRSDKRKKCDNAEDAEHTRPRASSMGQNIHRKKSSRNAVKKKGSVPPEIQLPSEYSLPDPIHFADDAEYDDCTVIKNNWKSPPPDSNDVSNSFRADTISSGITMVSSNDAEQGSDLTKNREIQKSTDSLGSFTQNFEDSSGWFDDVIHMATDSSTYIAEISEVKLTVTTENNENVYDTVAPDLLPEQGKLVVTDSPNLNTRVSSSVDSSGSFDSLEEDEDDDHLSPLTSDVSNALKGHSLPHRPVQTKLASPQSRPRSYSNVNQADDIVKNIQMDRNIRQIEDIKEVSIIKNVSKMSKLIFYHLKTRCLTYEVVHVYSPLVLA